MSLVWVSVPSFIFTCCSKCRFRGFSTLPRIKWWRKHWVIKILASECKDVEYQHNIGYHQLLDKSINIIPQPYHFVFPKLSLNSVMVLFLAQFFYSKMPQIGIEAKPLSLLYKPTACHIYVTSQVLVWLSVGDWSHAGNGMPCILSLYSSCVPFFRPAFYSLICNTLSRCLLEIDYIDLERCAPHSRKPMYV